MAPRACRYCRKSRRPRRSPCRRAIARRAWPTSQEARDWAGPNAILRTVLKDYTSNQEEPSRLPGVTAQPTAMIAASLRPGSRQLLGPFDLSPRYGTWRGKCLDLMVRLRGTRCGAH